MEQQNNTNEGGTIVTFEVLSSLSAQSTQEEVDSTIVMYSTLLDNIVKGFNDVTKASEIISRAWTVPKYGHYIVNSLFKNLEESEGIDLIMTLDVTEELHLPFARLLEHCLKTDSKTYVIDNWLEKVIEVACEKTQEENQCVHVDIIENLFDHDEATCSYVANLGGLDVVLFGCRSNDIKILRHCVTALLNVSLFCGPENYEEIVSDRKLHMWIFPLAFHADDIIKYYACLSVCVIYFNADEDTRAEVLKSGVLDLVESFVSSHNPSTFSGSDVNYTHEKNKNWLERLVPLLSFTREEVKTLAAFHFCMEAEIKTRDDSIGVFKEIGAIEQLKKIVGPEESVVSKYVTEALNLMAEDS